MLKHEDKLETPSQSAAQVRVTPEELATALSRIEARQDTDQRRANGTIPIGEAVQQLGVDTTPEEVLAEVQAIRQEPLRARKRLPPTAERLVLALGLAGILLGLGLDGNGLSQRNSHEAAASVSVSSVTPMPIQLDPDLLISTPSRNLVTLSKVHDNQPVRCNLSSQHNRVTFYQWTPGITTQDSWTLIKHAGKMYVRGWASGTSPAAMERNGLELRANPSQAYDVPVTLPLHGFKAVPYDGSGVRFRAKDIQLDQRANEKWQP